jgi:hypothetical protein
MGADSAPAMGVILQAELAIRGNSAFREFS